MYNVHLFIILIALVDQRLVSRCQKGFLVFFKLTMKAGSISRHKLKNNKKHRNGVKNSLIATKQQNFSSSKLDLTETLKTLGL